MEKAQAVSTTTQTHYSPPNNSSKPNNSSNLTEQSRKINVASTNQPPVKRVNNASVKQPLTQKEQEALNKLKMKVNNLLHNVSAEKLTQYEYNQLIQSANSNEERNAIREALMKSYSPVHKAKVQHIKELQAQKHKLPKYDSYDSDD